ncbi:MAG TPA: hypothetical protein VG714_04520 [Acidobacteriaceae bacterium]|nr:hypothetical protein [Acidobacteriaceae bacterium]
MKLAFFALIAAFAVTPAAVFAEAAPIRQHKNNQQDRIGQGVHSGQLTAGETARLEHQERGINREERGMRAQNHGHLTTQDRHTLRHQQRTESRRIYRDKHNARVR